MRIYAKLITSTLYNLNKDTIWLEFQEKIDKELKQIQDKDGEIVDIKYSDVPRWAASALIIYKTKF